MAGTDFSNGWRDRAGVHHPFNPLPGSWRDGDLDAIALEYPFTGDPGPRPGEVPAEPLAHDARRAQQPTRSALRFDHLAHLRELEKRARDCIHDYEDSVADSRPRQDLIRDRLRRAVVAVCLALMWRRTGRERGLL